MVNSIEKEIKYKKLAGKLAFYIFFIFFFIDKNVSENVSDEIKTFALSYAVTDMFIFFSSKVKNIKIPNCVFVIAIGVNIMLMFFFRKDQKFDIYFSYFFFLIILIAFIIPSIKIKPFKILKLSSDKKLMLFSYIVYTTILVIIKCIFNNLGIPIKNIIHINVNYIEYQLIVCTVYLDKLKDMYSLTLIGGTKEEIREFEKIVEKNKDNSKLNYELNKKLIKYWEKYLEEDDLKLENIIKILSETNKEFFKEKIEKLDKKIDEFNGNSEQKKELNEIKNRKVDKEKILVLEFVLYKTDIEKIIGETDDWERKELSSIEKLFLNYKGKYKKINIDWDNEVGKEIWYKDESEKSK